MDLVIDVGGQVRCLYGEAIALASLGKLSISRASYVEPDALGRWQADISPAGGPVLGPFALRSQALSAESLWLLEHRLLKHLAAAPFVDSTSSGR